MTIIMQSIQTSPERTDETNGNGVTILGVKIDSKGKGQVLKEVAEKIGNGEKFYIVTPYSEMFVMAAHDTKYKDILNNAAFAIPDGVVVRASERYLQMPMSGNRLTAVLQWIMVLGGIMRGRGNRGDQGDKVIQTIKGREFFVDLLSLADRKGWTIVFLGDGKESAQYAKRKLETKYPKAMIRAFTGPLLDLNGKSDGEEETEIEAHLIQTINALTPQLLFTGFGPPKQEKWIDRVLPMLRINCAIGLGGTFDYVNGTMPKPPKWMENHGLEWLYRVAKEPRRIGRMWNAVVIFSTLIIREKQKGEM